MQNKITLIANPTVAAIHQPTIEQKQELLSALSYQVMGYEQTYKFKTGAWDGRSSFFDWSSNTFPAGFLLFAAAKLRQKGYEVAVVRKPLPEPKGPIRPKVGDYPDDPRYEYQYEAVNRLVKYGGMIAMLATGCHAKGTRVLMYDGTFKNVENVVEGDLLMGPDSKPRKVLQLCRGRDVMYEISPISGGNPFIVNGDHILSLKQTNVGFGHGTRSHTSGQIVNVSVREYLTWNKHQKHIHKLYRSNGINFSNTKNFWLDPYVLGLLLGDAHFHKNGSVALTTPDIEIINYLNDWARMNFMELHCVPKKGTKALTVTFRRHKFQGYKETVGRKNVFRNPLHRAIYELGLLGTHSDNKFVPQQYKVGSMETRLKILAGLLDTDGYCSHNGFDYVSKSKQLAEDVAFIARSVGLKVSENIKTIKTGRYAGSSYFRLHITGNCEIIPNLVARKKAEPRKQIKSPTVTGFSIKELGEDSYYGFCLDGDHLYLLDDFTVTHNSGKSRVAELAFSRIRRPTLFLTTRSLLMYQMKNNVERDFKIPVSVIGDGEFGLDGDKTKLGLFTVATVQTLTSRLSGPDIHDRGETKRTKLAIQKQTLELLKKFEFVILEEAHEVSAGGYFEICKHCTNAAYRLALTATPFMKEDEEANMRLMGSSGPIGIRVTEKQLIDCGILARPYFKTIHLTQRPKKLFNSTKWASAYRLGIVLNEERNQKIIQEALRAKEYGLSVMCLVQQKDHGKILKQMMEKAGLKANFIFGEDKAKERQTNLAQLKNKEIDVLIGSTILDVGVDVPAVGMVVLAGAGKTQVANRQRIGRGLRAKKEGPNVCFVVDFDDPFNKYLVEHAMLRRRIVMTTPGFNEGFVADFPYELFEKVNK